jgi:hypothetical protein
VSYNDAVDCIYHTASLTYKWVRSIGGMTPRRENWNTQRQNCPHATTSPINPCYRTQASIQTGLQLTTWVTVWPGLNVDSHTDTIILMKMETKVLHDISVSNYGRTVYPHQTIQAISKVCNWYVEFKWQIIATNPVENQFIFPVS